MARSIYKVWEPRSYRARKPEGSPVSTSPRLEGDCKSVPSRIRAKWSLRGMKQFT